MLTVRDAASRVVVRAVSLPGQLYRVSTPAGSGLAPRVRERGQRVQVTLAPTGADGPDTVEVLLNRSVRWDLRLPAGAGEKYLDLAAGRLRRVALSSAAGLVTLRLPRPATTVPVLIAGPVGELVVQAPPGTAVRVRLRRGAAGVRGGPARPGTVLAPAGYATATRRFAVDVVAGAGTVTVARTVSAGRCVPSCSGGSRARGR